MDTKLNLIDTPGYSTSRVRRSRCVRADGRGGRLRTGGVEVAPEKGSWDYLAEKAPRLERNSGDGPHRPGLHLEIP